MASPIVTIERRILVIGNALTFIGQFQAKGPYVMNYGLLIDELRITQPVAQTRDSMPRVIELYSQEVLSSRFLVLSPKIRGGSGRGQRLRWSFRNNIAPSLNSSPS